MNLRRFLLPRAARIAAAGVMVAALSTAGAGRLAAAGAFHLHLVHSDPAADASVPAPLAIRLTFTEAPEVRVTTIQLADAQGRRAPLGPVHADRQHPATVFAAPTRPLHPGRYTLTWRTMAHDGHPMHGLFHFTVVPAGHERTHH